MFELIGKCIIVLILVVAIIFSLPFILAIIVVAMVFGIPYTVKLNGKNPVMITYRRFTKIKTESI